MPKLIFFGSSNLSVAVLDELEQLEMLPLAIVTQPDRPRDRSGRLAATPV